MIARLRTYLTAEPGRIWLALGIFSLLLRGLFSLSPAFTEAVYARGIFIGVRYLLDYTLGLLPFPVVEVAILALIIRFVIRRIKGFRTKGIKFKDRFRRFFWSTLGWLGALVFGFNILWGFNYQRVPVAETLGLEIAAPDSLQIRNAFLQATREMIAARSLIIGVSDSTLSDAVLGDKYEKSIREDLIAQLKSDGYPTPGRVRGRLIWPPGGLRQLGPIGIYIPFTGEGTVDGSLHPAQLPSTMAHEMSHGYGFADEGTCNFYAWRACVASENPLFRYSGWLSYWRYLSGDFRGMDPEGYKQVIDSLPAGIRSDFREMRRISERYSGWGSKLGTQINDVYLKAQGVKEGTENYDLMVLLIMAWERKEAGQ